MIAAPNVGYTALVLPLVISGIGASMAIPVVQNAVLGAVAPNEVGKASGANNMTQELVVEREVPARLVVRAVQDRVVDCSAFT
ncbi:MAG: hypothetical protein ACRDST_03980 [Pseudonocardiaceae bacterium]